MDTGTALISRILSHPDVLDSGAIANDLLREFHHGFALENLRKLLASENERISRVGAFIIAELGRKASPLLQDVHMMLRHPLMPVRYYAIDSVLSCSTGDDDDVLADTVRLLEDKERAVRTKTMDFILRASDDQLQGSVTGLEKKTGTSVHVTGIGGVIGKRKWSPQQTMAILNSDSVLLRRYAAVAAARMAQTDPTPLSLAVASKDEDIAKFAKDVVALKSYATGAG